MRTAKLPFNLRCNRGQVFFACTGIVYLFFLVGSVFARSFDRASVLSSNTAFSSPNNVAAGLGVDETDASSLQLQEFRRIEVKNGKLLWEVEAKEAKYLLKDDVTHVNDSALEFYRSDGEKISISSSAARLHSKGMSVGTAELEGRVAVQIGEQMGIRSELAIYDASTRTIMMPGVVEIDGNGFSITGKELEVLIDQQIIVLREKVNSKFEPSAKVPKGVRFK